MAGPHAHAYFGRKQRAIAGSILVRAPDQLVQAGDAAAGSVAALLARTAIDRLKQAMILSRLACEATAREKAYVRSYLARSGPLLAAASDPKQSSRLATSRLHRLRNRAARLMLSNQG
jgi:hypothetical protein